MTIQELLTVLQTYPPGLSVVENSYEEGDDDLSPEQVSLVKISLVTETREGVGKHGDGNHQPKKVPVGAEAVEAAVLHRGAELMVSSRSTEQTAAGEWRSATIDEIAEKVAMGPFGSSIKVETFVPEGVPIISGQHLRGFRVDDGSGFNFITPEHARRLANANVQRGDIIFTHAGNIGQVAYIPDDSRYGRYVISQRQFFMRCDPSKAIPEFVVLYFRSPEGQHQLLANTSQVGVPSIAQPVTYLRTIGVKLPPLPEQRAIAHILGKLDDKIELNRRMNETLKEMALALFKSWFVNFDPVRAKMVGRWRRGESLPGLPAEHYDLFPDRLVLSQLGEIPEGWEVKELGDVIEIHDRRRVPLNSRQRANRRGSIRYYGAAGIMDYVDDFLFEGVYVLTGEDGTVIDTNGHPVVQYIWGQFWVNNHAHVLTGRNGISEEHLCLLLEQVNITAFVTGAVQPKLSQRNLKAIPIVFPGEWIYEAFSGLIAPLFAKVRVNSDESEILAVHRDALLPKLVLGEMKINHSTSQVN